MANPSSAGSGTALMLLFSPLVVLIIGALLTAAVYSGLADYFRPWWQIWFAYIVPWSLALATALAIFFLASGKACSRPASGAALVINLAIGILYYQVFFHAGNLSP